MDFLPVNKHTMRVKNTNKGLTQSTNNSLFFRAFKQSEAKGEVFKHYSNKTQKAKISKCVLMTSY